MPAATSDHPRTVHVEHCMGTVFTIDIRDSGDWTAPIAAVCKWLHHVDSVFSTYRPDTDISRIRRGELPLDAAASEVADVLDLCARAQRETDGYFTAIVDGVLDPTGLVKGWSIERASEILRGYGSGNHAVNGGGDMQVAGYAAAGTPWRIGISDPDDTGQILAVVTGTDFAVATSGTNERGAHIVNPFTGAPASDIAAVTVVGRSLTQVDAYATAAFARGAAALAWLDGLPGYEGLVVALDGAVTRTAGFDDGMAAAGH